MRIRGFTLIELTIVAALLGIIGLAVISILVRTGVPEPVSEVPGFDVITDSVTGCQYIRPEYRNSVPPVPRMGSDGKQICNPPTVESAR